MHGPADSTKAASLMQQNAMRIVEAAQPIRTYEPPISIVWTQGEPCTEADCALLTAALRRGHADIIEHGRWGPYSSILRWSHAEEKPLYFLADVREDAASEAAR
jgi:hypothetical protein